MIKKLKKVGNSNAVVLDKPLLELVGLREGDAIQIAVREGSIVLTPVSPALVPEDEFEAALEKVVRTRAKVLKKLSE